MIKALEKYNFPHLMGSHRYINKGGYYEQKRLLQKSVNSRFCHGELVEPYNEINKLQIPFDRLRVTIGDFCKSLKTESLLVTVFFVTTLAGIKAIIALILFKLFGMSKEKDPNKASKKFDKLLYI